MSEFGNVSPMTAMRATSAQREARPTHLLIGKQHFHGTFTHFSYMVEGQLLANDNVTCRAAVDADHAMIFPGENDIRIGRGSLSSPRYLTEGSNRKAITETETASRTASTRALSMARAARSRPDGAVECDHTFSVGMSGIL